MLPGLRVRPALRVGERVRAAGAGGCRPWQIVHEGNGGVCVATFVPAFVSRSVAAWHSRPADAMAAAGKDHRDLDARTVFAAEWDDPAHPRADPDDVVAHLEHLREVAGSTTSASVGTMTVRRSCRRGSGGRRRVPATVRRPARSDLVGRGLSQAGGQERAAGAACRRRDRLVSYVCAHDFMAAANTAPRCR